MFVTLSGMKINTLPKNVSKKIIISQLTVSKLLYDTNVTPPIRSIVLPNMVHN